MHDVREDYFGQLWVLTVLRCVKLSTPKLGIYEGTWLTCALKFCQF